MDEFKILCPFCNAPWDAEMETELQEMNDGCDTCGYGASAVIMLTITCSNCGKTVYAKEVEAE